MIKKLIFAVALLAPGLAYGGNPSANLTVQIDPALPNSIACDIGPNYTGSIPAAATQAGFTHCAANYDFTQTAPFTSYGNIYQWSNLASWFTCSGGPTTTGYLWHHSVGSDTVACDTAHQNITTDSGVQVLAMTYYLTDKQANLYNNEIDTMNVSTGVTTSPFPEAFYVEEVWKPSTVNVCDAGIYCLYHDLSAVAVNAFDGTNRCFFGEDFDEAENAFPTINTDISLWNMTCGTSSYGSGTVSPASPSPVTTGYTTYGNLVTADNIQEMELCAYWGAGVVAGLPGSSFQGCRPASLIPPSTSPIFTNHMGFYLVGGAPYNNYMAGAHYTATSSTSYIQRITVWVCPNPTGGADWRTGQCWNNPVISTHP